MANQLSVKQARILDWIARSLEAEGRPPSFREIAEGLGLALATVRDHVRVLKAKGALSSEEGKARSFRLAGGLSSLGRLSLPVLGRVPAGFPAEAIENLEGQVSVDQDMARGANFALRVRGDSMAPEILEGDLVLVRQTAHAESGQRVVAHVEGAEATVKVLRRKGAQAWLEALNTAYGPIRARFTIVGRVVGMTRRYPGEPWTSCSN